MSSLNVAPVQCRVNAHAVNGDTDQPAVSVASSRKAADYTIEQCRAVASRAFSIACSAAGMSQRAAADSAGVSRNLAQWWADPEHPRTVPVGRLLIMAETSRRGRDVALSTLTAILSHVQHATHPLDRPRVLRDLVDDVHAEVGELACEWRAAIADGEVTAAERESLARRVNDVQRVLAGLMAELEVDRG